MFDLIGTKKNSYINLLVVILLAINGMTSLCAQNSDLTKSAEAFKKWRHELDSSNDIQNGLIVSKETLPLVNDSCKVEILFVIGDIFLSSSQQDSTKYYHDQGIELANKMQSEYLMIKGLMVESALFVDKGEYEKSKANLAKASLFLKKIPEHRDLWIKYYNEMGSIADSESNYELAMDYLNIIAKEGYYSDSIELAINYHNIGFYAFRLSDYATSSENLLKAAEINEKIIGGDLTANYYILSYAYAKWKQLDLAIRYSKKAVRLSKIDKNDLMIGRCYSALSSFYRLTDQKEKSLVAIDSALLLLGPLDDDFEISKAYLEKGKLYDRHFGDDQKAEFYYIQSWESALNTVPLAKYAPSSVLVSFYLEKKNIPKAKVYLEELRKICAKLKRKDYYADLYKVESRYYELTGNPTQALKFYKQFYETNDSIANQDILSRVAGMERKFDSKQKEVDILRLSQEKKEESERAEKATFLQKMYAGLAALLGVLFFSIVFFVRKIKKQNTSLELAHKKMGELNKVKDRLFSIIAHDVRGMIIPFQRAGKVLSYHLDKGNHERAKSLSAELEKNSQGLSTMLDNLLKWSLDQMDGYNIKEESFNIREEMESIMEVFSQHASFKDNVLEIIPKEDETIIFDKGAFHVIFRNLIGNALKFTEAGTIQADWKKVNNELQVVISDTGVGMSAEQRQKLFDLKNNESVNGTAGEKGTGLGLHLVHQFTSKLKGRITVSSKVGQGSQFILTFPQA